LTRTIASHIFVLCFGRKG